MMPSFLHPSTPQAFVKSASEPFLSFRMGSSAISSPTSRTTLSQRFRRAIKQGDLGLAKRVASRALELQQHRRPSAYKALEPPGLSSPTPSKATLRAALAQRPPVTHPFDIRNIEHSEHEGKKPKLHYRSYSMGINHDENLNNDSDSSLVLAIKNGADIELIRWLIEMGHEKQGPSTDAYGHTVLHLSALYDRADIIYAYSTYSTSHLAVPTAEIVDSFCHHDHRTALHMACIKGFEDVARQLLDLGADIDLSDREGNTALHCASSWGHLSLVQLLIERGCSFAVKNCQGFTAADFAFTHSVKAALEAFGRAQFEVRKRTRRAQANAYPGSSGMLYGNSFDEGISTRITKPKASGRPHPLALGSSAKMIAFSYSDDSTPVNSSYPLNGGSESGGGRSLDLGNELSRSSYNRSDSSLYDDWDPEKTFAQPGQDLHPGTRNALASPPRQRIASPPQASINARLSVDLYSEFMTNSVRETGRSFLPPAFSDSEHHRSTTPHTTSSQGQYNWSPEERRTATMDGSAGRPSPLVPSQSESAVHNQYPSRVPSPGTGAVFAQSPTARSGLSPRMGVADQVRQRDAAAMSLFRHGSSQSSRPERHGTPPIPSPRQGASNASHSPLQKSNATLSSSLPANPTMSN